MDSSKVIIRSIRRNEWHCWPVTMSGHVRDRVRASTPVQHIFVRCRRLALTAAT
jgi:hypothetical protein